MAYSLKTEIWLPRGLEEVFSFFSDAHNLEKLTPPWLRFEVLEPAPSVLQAGTLIDYRLRLRGIPVRWQSEISAWEPPNRFVDEQRRGPYRFWIHEHTFISRDGGTLVRDTVEYDLFCGPLINRFFVRRDLERIFAYRQGVLESVFQKEA